MSEDGFSDPYDEPTMEIFIETLTGTSFEMRVDPTDTIFNIKNKIQRVEGIPVSHQNLIYNMKELEDYKKLCDIGVRNGSTLKLVLAMRGGPISTRRLSTCDHHIMWKNLKELIESSRDEIGDKMCPGSRISLLVFKEGDVINLLRVIESENGTVVPYNEDPISPPSKSLAKEDSQSSVCKKLIEDQEMLAKVSQLRQKLENVSLKRQLRSNKPVNSNQGKLKSPKRSLTEPLTYKLLTDKEIDVTVCKSDLNNEDEEIALKEKHRSKFLTASPQKSVESHQTNIRRQINFDMAHKRSRHFSNYFTPDNNYKLGDVSNSSSTSSLAETNMTRQDDETDDVFLPCPETLSMSAHSCVHLTRLVLSDTNERPKSTPDSIELEENAQDVWEIHEPTTEHIRNSATCKLGLLKRRQSLDCSLEDEATNVKRDGDFNGDFEVFGKNVYHVTPSAIPPQYAPKEERTCDYLLGGNSKVHRSPLYGRRSLNTFPNLNSLNTNPKNLGSLVENYPKIQSDLDFPSGTSSIERIRNDIYSDNNEDGLQDFYGVLNVKKDYTHNSRFFKPHELSPLRLKTNENAQELANEIKRLGYMDGDNIKTNLHIEKTKLENLPAVNKKRLRCEQCNKRLNVTTMYNCRCGRLFCAQHRYSETHNCKYDYKTEGRRLLEQQNPLVVANKLPKF